MDGGSAAESTGSIKLLIKASNQQFDDQIIESDLLWTVKRLKTQLSIVYPSKPPVAEQKLIYLGQLLNDTVQLKDIIRNYKDVYTQNHIFHLVYTPRNVTQPKIKLSKTNQETGNMRASSVDERDGVRQRRVANLQQQQQHSDLQQQQPERQQQQLQQQQTHQQQHGNNIDASTSQPQQQHPYNYVRPQFIPQMLGFVNATAQGQQCPENNPNMMFANTMPFSLPGQLHMQAIATRQTAMYNWMQQVYSQYMEQYVQMSNGANFANFPNNMPTPNNADGATANMLLPNPFLQQMPFMSPNLTANAAGTTTVTSSVIQFPSATSTPASTAAATFVAQAQTQSGIAEAQVPNAPIDPPVVPNENAPAAAAAAPRVAEPQDVEQVAPAPRFPNIVQDDQENRDWLDSLFSVMRLAIFLTVLYFNSSPLRCLAVVIIGGGMYLYHIGVFRIRHERNNNNINRNNNADQIRQGVQQVQEAQAMQEGYPRHDAVNNDENAADDDADAIGNAAPVQQTANNNNNGDGTGAVPIPNNPNENTSDEGDTEAVEQQQQDENGSSFFSVMRTFVITFVTSLLPETPTL